MAHWVSTTAAAGLLGLAALAAGCGGTEPAGRQTLDIALVDEGCSPAKHEAKSGTITFQVSNGGTTKVNELELKRPNGILLSEKENIVGDIVGAFTLTLQPGRYVLSCPNGTTSNQGELVVSGERLPARPLPDAELKAAVSGYRAYIAQQVRVLERGVDRFASALEAGDLEKAKDLYGPVRLPYEAIEPVAESFGDLDPRLDARDGDTGPGTTWTGFHRIEQILWVRGTTKGTAELARQLRADTAELREESASLTFQPAQLANGAVELLDEVSNSKISGEEDRYSHTDLSDFQGNLTGSRKAFDLLRPALRKQGEDELVETIEERFDAVQAGLDRYRRSTPLGFALYDELTAEDRREFSQQIDALAEPLSTVAGKVSA